MQILEYLDVAGRELMALTRDFKATVKARAERDVAFREALLTEAVEQLIAGEVEVGKAVLRDYINATVGFVRPDCALAWWVAAVRGSNTQCRLRTRRA